MIGNCEVIQSLFSRYLRDELTLAQREELELHTAVCESCRGALEFERLLDARLSAPADVPDSLIVKAKARVVAGLRPPSWYEQILGRTLMRRMLVSGTALAALFVVTLTLFPTGARATTPREAFRQMKAAMAAAKKQMDVTVIAVVTQDNRVQATVTSPDGKPVATPMNVNVAVQRQGSSVQVTATVSFDESDYSNIAFGKDKNTLVLIPKKQPSRKYEVVVDGKTKLPRTWTAYEKHAKAWIKLGAYRFAFKDRKAAQDKAG